MSAKPRILLVSPVFHGYWQSIEAGFRTLGFQIGTHCYDTNTTLANKVSHKVVHELPVRLGARAARIENGRQTAETAAVIRSFRPDITLVIRGDRFGDELFDALDDVGSRRFLWLWDEVRRTAHTPDSLARYNHLISYSPLDTRAFSTAGTPCLHVPNAFDPALSPTPRHTSEVVFIGARYPRRDALLTAVAAADVPLRCYGREWSRHPFDRARTWQVRRPEVPAARDIDREDGYALTAGAPAAINIHSDQDGFTMKTFEVPGVGGVQLVDREDVAEYYEPGREAAVFRDADELVELCQRAIHDDRWGDALREAGRRRTLAEHTWAHRAAKVAQLWA
ncbi:CgeB family protein [Tessaracoccus sp. G1721]